MCIYNQIFTWLFAKKGEMKIPTDNMQFHPDDHRPEKTAWRPTIISVFGLLLLTGFVVKTFVNKNTSIGLNEINLILFALVMIVFPEHGKHHYPVSALCRYHGHYEVFRVIGCYDRMVRKYFFATNLSFVFFL